MSKKSPVRDFGPLDLGTMTFHNPIRKPQREHLNIFHTDKSSIQEKRAKRAEYSRDTTCLIAIKTAKNMRKRVTNMSGTILFKRSLTDSQRCPIIDGLISKSTSYNLNRAPAPITRNSPFLGMKSNLPSVYKPISIFNNHETVEVSNPQLATCTSVKIAQKCQYYVNQSDTSETNHNPKFGFIKIGLLEVSSEEKPLSKTNERFEIASPAASLPLSQIMLTKYSGTLCITASS